jgi:hypothetical protein
MYKKIISKYIQKQKKQKKCKTINVAFSGGGMAGLYQSGAIGYLIGLCRKKLLSINHVLGSSVGAYSGIITCFMLYDNSFTINKLMKIINKQIKNDKENRQLINAWCNLLHKYLPKDIYKFCNNKLFIGIQVQEGLNFVHKVISNYKSNEHLIDVIYTSMSLPFLTIPTMFKKYKCPYDKKVYNAMDGVFTPDIKDTKYKTLYVNIYKHPYDIKKRLLICEDSYDFLVKEGIHDMYNFFTKNKTKPTIYYCNNDDFKKGSLLKKEDFLSKSVIIQFILYSILHKYLELITPFLIFRYAKKRP